MGAPSRADALRIRSRTEDEQCVWEIRSLEDAQLRVGRHRHGHTPPAIGFGALYQALLAVRASSTIAEGPLLHLRAPHCEAVLLTGEFRDWATHPLEGGIPMIRIDEADWVAVVPSHALPPRRRPYPFKFLATRDGSPLWANGVYLVDQHDSFANSLLPVTGDEVTYERRRALERLQTLGR